MGTGAPRHGWCAAVFDVLRAGRVSKVGRRDPIWVAHKHHSSSLPRRADGTLYPLWATDPNTVGKRVSPVLGLWFSQLQYMLLVILAMGVVTSPFLIYYTIVNENDFGKENLGGFALFGGQNSTLGKVDFMSMTTVYPRLYLKGAEYDFVQGIKNASSTIDNLIKQLRRPQPGESTVEYWVIWVIWISWVVLWCFLYYLSQRLKFWAAEYDTGTDESDFSVVVDGIPPDATAHDISAFFEQWGQVARVTRIGLIDPILPKLHDRKRRLLENIGELEWVESHSVPSRSASPRASVDFRSRPSDQGVATATTAPLAPGAQSMGLDILTTPTKSRSAEDVAVNRPRTGTMEQRKRHVSHQAREALVDARTRGASGYGSSSSAPSSAARAEVTGEDSPKPLTPSGLSSLNLSEIGNSKYGNASRRSGCQLGDLSHYPGGVDGADGEEDQIAARAFRITEAEGGIKALEELLARTRRKLEGTQRQIAERIAFAGQKMIQHTMASAHSHSSAAAARAARADGISGVVFVSFVESQAAILCLQAWDPLLQQPNTVDAALRQIAFGFAAGLGWEKPPAFPPPGPAAILNDRSKEGRRGEKKGRKKKGGERGTGGKRGRGERGARGEIADARRRAAWQWFRTDRGKQRRLATEVSVKRAPRISDIRWGNLTVSPWRKIIGTCGSVALVALAVFVALGIQIVYVWSSVAALACTNKATDMVLGLHVCDVVFAVGLQDRKNPCIVGGTSCSVTSTASIWNWALTCLLGLSRWFITVLVVPSTNKLSRLYQYRDQEQRAHFRISAVLEIGYFMLSLLLYVVQVAVLNSTGGAHLEYPVAQNFSEFWFRLILLDTLGQIWGHLIRPQTFFKRVWAAKHAKTQADLNRQWRDKPVRPFLLYRQMLRVVTVPLLIGAWSPLIYWVSLLEGIIFYGVQKYSILRHRQQPPKIGVRLATEMMRALWIISALTFVCNVTLSTQIQPTYFIIPTCVALLTVLCFWCALWLMSKDDVRRNMARLSRWIYAHMSCCSCLFPTKWWWWCYSNVAVPTETSLLVEADTESAVSGTFQTMVYEPYEPPWNANIGGFTVDFVGGSRGDATPGRVAATVG